jgi:RimJ/RimL family protein N-acetyltransferase
MDSLLSERLTYRRMTEDDLELIVRLLGEPAVMTHYDHPKTHEECRAWIDWNKRNYARDGYGLWIIETHDGEFVGECGLTWQPVDGESLELGYHVLPIHQGNGYASEAARASVELARQHGEKYVIAIIAPGNGPSIRVAEKAGLTYHKHVDYHGNDALIYHLDLAPTA